ncbi:hypothetical protein JDV02_005161 [Purpureocillium takamizusanense]|uniref:Uncharacterized protein n=1 Tax=Purpureocillium takamizusanense TaxID=2060973 RepID=A0A9Q8VBL3_9HYPO|nr:uncharacterized protein JDV02_005161 [Purpureocillium takamizusanense]UNI18932.1 hypothetical protein JDV02_005161 [Purpureocillium takamizusanense]
MLRPSPNNPRFNASQQLDYKHGDNPQNPTRSYTLHFTGEAPKESRVICLCCLPEGSFRTYFRMAISPPPSSLLTSPVPILPPSGCGLVRQHILSGGGGRRTNPIV